MSAMTLVGNAFAKTVEELFLLAAINFAQQILLAIANVQEIKPFSLPSQWNYPKMIWGSSGVVEKHPSEFRNSEGCYSMVSY